MPIAWGSRVSASFRGIAVGACGRLGIADPSWLMACMAFESGYTFRADIRNAAGSGAVGLIQFMPGTASALGTSPEELAVMSPEVQLAYVEAYFRPRAGKLLNLGDVYGAILWPGMIGKPDNAIIFRKGDPNRPKLYLQNRGLDIDGDGDVERGEATAKVRAALERGLLPGNAF